MTVRAFPDAELDDLVWTLEARFAAAVRKAFGAATEKLFRTARAMTAAGIEPWVSVDDAGVATTVWQAEVPGLAEQVQGVYVAAGQGVMSTLSSAAGLSHVPQGPFDVLNQHAADHLAQVRNRLVRFGDAAWSDIRGELLEGFKAGEGIEPMSRRLRGVSEMSQRRARTVARTEVISASNTGATAGAMSLPAELRPVTKTWLATRDSRTRPDHVAANRQTVPFTGKFTVGGWAMAYPGEWGAPAAEVINCRCTVLFDAEPLPETATEVASVADPVRNAPAGRRGLGDPSGGAPVLNAEQYAALKPRPLDIRTRDRRTIKPLRSTPDGRLLNETMSSFQRGSNAITRLRTDIMRRVQGLPVAERTAHRIDVLLNAIRNAPDHVPSPRLFRGIKLEGATAEDVLARYRPGQTLDMNISSFTSDASAARRFASNPAGAARRKFDGASVVLELDQGAAALPIQNISPNLLFHNEREWLTGGRFRVNEVVQRGDVTYVRIVQEDVL